MPVGVIHPQACLAASEKILQLWLWLPS